MYSKLLYMNVVDRFIQSIAKKRGIFTMPAADYTPSYLGVNQSGVKVTHDNALTFTGAFSAISTKSETLASLPKTVFKNSYKGKIIDTKHPVYKLLHFRPNKYMTDFAFFEMNEARVAGWGNGVNIIETNGNGYPVNLWPIKPTEYEIVKDNHELYYKITNKDFAGTYHSSEILHFKYFTLDGINGIDPISYHAQSLGIGLGGQSFANEYFATKGKMRGVFEMDTSLGEEEYKQWMKRMEKAKDHSTPLLEYGIKYKNISVSPDAAQAIQSRLFSIQDAARIWKVPVSLLSEHSHSTFSNTEQQDIQFVKYGLRPECKRFETEIETKLFAESEREVYNVKFNLEGLLRGDLKTRAEYLRLATGGRPWMIPDEAREIENMEPIGGKAAEYIDPANIIGNQTAATDNNKTQQ